MAALALFLAASVVPVFFARLRSMPFWLALQALALGWTLAGLHGTASGHALAAVAEVLVVRALIAPLLLRQALRRRGDPNLDLMPSNLFAWVIAAALVVLAFEFGAPGMTDRHALALGAVAATVAVALLLLAANDLPPAQLTALLWMENAVGLFESLLPEPWPLPVHMTLSAIYLLTAAAGAWLIGWPDELPAEAVAAMESPEP